MKHISETKLVKNSTQTLDREPGEGRTENYYKMLFFRRMELFTAPGVFECYVSENWLRIGERGSFSIEPSAILSPI